MPTSFYIYIYILGERIYIGKNSPHCSPHSLNWVATCILSRPALSYELITWFSFLINRYNRLLNCDTFEPPFKLWKKDLFPELIVELAETDLFLDPRSDKERFLPEAATVLFRAGVVRGVYAGGGLIEGILD